MSERSAQSKHGSSDYSLAPCNVEVYVSTTNPERDYISSGESSFRSLELKVLTQVELSTPSDKNEDQMALCLPSVQACYTLLQVLRATGELDGA